MKPRILEFTFHRKTFYRAIAVSCVVVLSQTSSLALAQEAQPQATTTTTETPKISNDELDSLVAPIALYPDPLLSQMLAASTYPLEIIQLQQWLERNKNLKGKALTDAVAKQDWDPSVQAMAAFPDVVKKLADNIQWTTDLGNAFLAQPSDVMDAVQRMRAKAQSTGNLKTGAQQNVKTQTVEGGKQVIVIEPASPDVVYVPTYDPVVVYGPPVYPYPLLFYPPGYYTGMALSFGAGFALGAAWGGWGWNFGWGGGNIIINNNNVFINNYNHIHHRFYAHGGNRWRHDPQHRRGAPYNRASASQVQHELAEREQRGARGGERAGGEPRGERFGERGRSEARAGAGERIGRRRVSPEPGWGFRHNAFGAGREFGGREARLSSFRGRHSMGFHGFRGGRFRGGGFHRGGRRR